MSTPQRSAWAGFLAGALGGALATAAMDLFQATALKGTQEAERLAGSDHHLSQEQKGQIKGYEAAHAVVAKEIASVTTGSELHGKQLQTAATATHYAFGAICGGVYGLIAEFWPAVTFGFGTAFGTSLLLGASETTLPALGLAPSPAETPAVLHSGALAAHAVYGAGTEAVRTLLRRD